MIERSRLPVVTLILIAANLLAAFWLAGVPILRTSMGFRANAPTIAAAFTCLFLHANVLHLLGNMVFLAAVGAAVEMASGSIRFASVYFVSGLVGVFAHYLMTRHAEDPAPFIGASGCIAGCAGYYSFRYTGMKVPILPGKEVSVAAITGLWVVLQVVGGFVRLGDTGGEAFWAHLGGFATGIVLSLLFRAPDVGQTKIGHALIDKMSDRGPAAVVAAAQRHLKDHPNDPKALDDLAKAYGELEDHPREGETLIRLLDGCGEEKLPSVLKRIDAIGQVAKLPVMRRLKYAERIKDAEPQTARSLLESVLRDRAEPQRPEAMLSLAALEREEHPDRAEAILRELAESYPLHPATDVARKRGWVN